MWWLALILLMLSTLTLMWSMYQSFFRPTQWHDPKNKTIFITGCDSGIGFQLTRHFLRKGSNVVATFLSLKSDGARELQDEFAHQRSFFPMELDLTRINGDSCGQVEKIKKVLRDNDLEIHALVSNAGVCIFGEADFLTPGQVEVQVAVNFTGPIHLVKYFLSDLIKSKGRIVNVSSVSAMCSMPGIGVYCGTKRGFECFLESLAIEMDKFQVQVLTVRLGDFANLTNIMANHEKHAKEQYESFDLYRQKIYRKYFEKLQKLTAKHVGYFSPKSYQESTLFDDFDEAVYAVKPRNYLMVAIPIYKIIIYFLYFLPNTFTNWIFSRFVTPKLEN